jgi:rod shape-determining protein MreC
VQLSRTNRRIWVVLGIGLVLVMAGTIGKLGPIVWTFDHTIVPIGSGLSNLGSSTSQMFSNIAAVRSLAEDNAKLEQENASLRQQVAADASIRRDNDQLRAQLGLEAAGGPQEIASEVVAFDPESYRQFVTINKGSRSGIKAGQAVVSGGVLIGMINDVSSSTARVMLITDPDFKLVAEDQNTAADGLVEGQLGGGLELNDIGQTDSVKPGDSVTTSGLSGTVPAGLLIGTVESVNTRTNVVFQTAQVQSTFQLNKLRFAYVVVGQ